MVFSWFLAKKPSKANGFLALGDSIISDCYPGVDRGAASLVFRNVDPEFPEFRGIDLKTTASSKVNFVNLTRSGFQLDDVERSLARIPEEMDIRWILLSVGGNDLLAGGLDILQFEKRYRQFVKRLRARFPAADLAILNAYDPTDGTGLVMSSIERGKPPHPQIVNELARLNETIAHVAEGHLVDVHGHFLGHGASRQLPSAQGEEPDLSDLWYQRDIEPNVKGASELRRLIYRKFQGGENWPQDSEKPHEK